MNFTQWAQKYKTSSKHLVKFKGPGNSCSIFVVCAILSLILWQKKTTKKPTKTIYSSSKPFCNSVIQILIRNCFQGMGFCDIDLWPCGSNNKKGSQTRHTQPSMEVLWSWEQFFCNCFKKVLTHVSLTTDPLCLKKGSLTHHSQPSWKNLSSWEQLFWSYQLEIILKE